MTIKAVIKKVDPATTAAHAMMDALWKEIQSRYGFKAPNPFVAASFSADQCCFWVAFIGEEPVGSIAIAPLSDQEAELDIMYVAPQARGSGIAHELLMELEQFARENKFAVIKLRSGAPQPEAIRFYEKEGFYPIPGFGKWIDDSTALCFEKKL